MMGRMMQVKRPQDALPSAQPGPPFPHSPTLPPTARPGSTGARRGEIPAGSGKPRPGTLSSLTSALTARNNCPAQRVRCWAAG